MNQTFIILGYGIPKNFFKDDNYRFYLNMVFNKIWDISSLSNSKPLIIATGGKTDCFKPYKRTEAQEIIKYLKILANRSFVKAKTKSWKFIPENKSLSSLENIIFCKKLLEKIPDHGKINIFCEQTRVPRVTKIANKLLKGSFKIIPMDFDVTSNRYHDPEFINKKEQTELKHIKWALQSPENLKKHHQVFKEKMDFLRKEGTKNHPEAVKKWWEMKLKEFNV
ncbi:hypothetical protein KKG46_00195 [Patescibacteria group bacterium]|nr:hypothetical protein [Patescibacteria group bacterium]